MCIYSMCNLILNVNLLLLRNNTVFYKVLSRSPRAQPIYQKELDKVRQNCVQLPTPVDNVTLLAFAAVGPATQQSIDISSNCSS